MNLRGAWLMRLAFVTESTTAASNGMATTHKSRTQAGAT